MQMCTVHMVVCVCTNTHSKGQYMYVHVYTKQDVLLVKNDQQPSTCVGMTKVECYFENVLIFVAGCICIYRD